jgi:hypothetical protein
VSESVNSTTIMLRRGVTRAPDWSAQGGAVTAEQLDASAAVSERLIEVGFSAAV